MNIMGGQILRNNGARRLGRPRTGVLTKKLPEEWTEELTEELREDLIEVTNSGRLQRWKTATGKQKWKTACACPFTIPFSQGMLDFKSSFSQGILSPYTPRPAGSWPHTQPASSGQTPPDSGASPPSPAAPPNVNSLQR